MKTSSPPFDFEKLREALNKEVLNAIHTQVSIHCNENGTLEDLAVIGIATIQAVLPIVFHNMKLVSTVTLDNTANIEALKTTIDFLENINLLEERTKLIASFAEDENKKTLH